MARFMSELLLSSVVLHTSTQDCFWVATKLGLILSSLAISMGDWGYWRMGLNYAKFTAFRESFADRYGNSLCPEDNLFTVSYSIVHGPLESIISSWFQLQGSVVFPLCDSVMASCQLWICMYQHLLTLSTLSAGLRPPSECVCGYVCMGVFELFWIE